MSSKRGKNQISPESENLSGQELACEVSPLESKNTHGKPKGSGLIWLYVLAGALVCAALAELWTTHTTLSLQETIQGLQIKIKELENLKPSQAINSDNTTEDRLSITENRLNEAQAEQASLSSRIEAMEDHLDALSHSLQAAFEKMEELSQSQEHHQGVLFEDAADKDLNPPSASLSSLVQALESDAAIELSLYETLIPETLLMQLKDVSKSPPISKDALLKQCNDLSHELQPAFWNPEDHLTKTLGNFITIRKISPSAHESAALREAQALASKIQIAITEDDYDQAIKFFNALSQKAKDVLSPLEHPLEQNHKKQVLIQKLKSLLSSSSRSTHEPGHDIP
jgi:hypothetical protein